MAVCSPRSAVHEGKGQQGVFFGWIVVACTFSILCVAYGIQFSFGVFLPEISAELGWSRTSLSLPYSLYVFIYGVLGAVAGRLTDRWGPRMVVMLGGWLLGGGIAMMSSVRALWQVYLFLGFIAATGMSAAFVPCNATVVRWFTRRRGLALGIASSGASFGNFIFPPLIAALISAYGWRQAYLFLGLGGLVLLNLLAVPVIRDPERMGLEPDGFLANNSDPRSTGLPLPASGPVLEWTLAEARHASTFWLLTALFTCTWLVVFLPLVHLAPFATDLGIPQVRAAMTLSMIGLAGFVGRLTTGPISDRVGRKKALGLCLLLQALSFIAFIFSTGLGLLYPASALFGLSYGGTSVLFPAIVGDYFGRQAVGSIVGFIFALAGSTAAFGPALAGYVYDATGRYTTAFALSALLNTAAFLLLLALKKPERRGT